MLYNRPPSLSHLKTFGCLCYATAVSPKQKFDPRSRQCIFIGYPLNKKIYKLFDIDARTFFYKSGCHLPWKCFPILPTVPDTILTSITRYFVHYWHWLTHSCPTFTRSTFFSYSSQCTWTSIKLTFFSYSSQCTWTPIKPTFFSYSS